MGMTKVSRQGRFRVTVGAAHGTIDDMTGERQAGGREQAGGSVGSAWTATFEALYLEHHTRVVSVLLRLVGNPTEAEELANDVFWRLYRQPLTPSPDGNVGGWLYRTATNLGIDALRAAARRREYERSAGEMRARAGGAAGDPLEGVLRAEKRGRVLAVLARLKPNQAQILVLRSSGFAYKELAEILGVKGGSVGTMLARAEAEFHRAYVEAYGSEEDL